MRDWSQDPFDLPVRGVLEELAARHAVREMLPQIGHAIRDSLGVSANSHGHRPSDTVGIGRFSRLSPEAESPAQFDAKTLQISINGRKRGMVVVPLCLVPFFHEIRVPLLELRATPLVQRLASGSGRNSRIDARPGRQKRHRGDGSVRFCKQASQVGQSHRVLEVLNVAPVEPDLPELPPYPEDMGSRTLASHQPVRGVLDQPSIKAQGAIVDHRAGTQRKDDGRRVRPRFLCRHSPRHYDHGRDWSARQCGGDRAAIAAMRFPGEIDLHARSAVHVVAAVIDAVRRDGLDLSLKAGGRRDCACDGADIHVPHPSVGVAHGHPQFARAVNEMALCPVRTAPNYDPLEVGLWTNGASHSVGGGPGLRQVGGNEHIPVLRRDPPPSVGSQDWAGRVHRRPERSERVSHGRSPMLGGTLHRRRGCRRHPTI